MRRLRWHYLTSGEDTGILSRTEWEKKCVTIYKGSSEYKMNLNLNFIAPLWHNCVYANVSHNEIVCTDKFNGREKRKREREMENIITL